MSKQTTKEKILIAARKLFVEHGFAGTSIGNIAKLANINHSLIFHHFENKEKLWIAVKQNIAKDNEGKSKTLSDIHLSFKEFLQELIENSMKFYQENPDIIRMINWQRLEKDDDEKIGVTLSDEAQAWLKALKHYQNKKEINSKHKVEYVMTLILSIASSAAMDQYIFLKSKKDQKNYIEFCVEQLIKGLR